MKSSLRYLVVVAALAAAGSATQRANAQCATCGDVYKIVCQTVYEERQVTAYRQECETVMENVEVTRQVPVWETQHRERRFTVTKPVTETSMREERYTVQRPVYETVMRDASYNVVRNVQETSEREERFVVQRPVTETVMREERFVVQKPVTETVQQTQYRTVMRPVTTYTTQYADQGGFQDVVSCVPGCRSWPRLAWQQPVQTCDPMTGAVTTTRGGLAWTQTETPARQVVNRVWKPNIVAVQVPQTGYVAEQVAECVPVQVCKMVAEEQVRQVPVQVCKMVAEEQVRKVPVTTCRQVVERVERQVPVQVCKYGHGGTSSPGACHDLQVRERGAGGTVRSEGLPHRVSKGNRAGAAGRGEAGAGDLHLSRTEDGRAEGARRSVRRLVRAARFLVFRIESFREVAAARVAAASLFCVDLSRFATLTAC